MAGCPCFGPDGVWYPCAFDTSCGKVDIFEKNSVEGMEVLSVAGITPMFGFPPDGAAKAALEDEKTLQAMEVIARDYAERPEIVAQSSRILAVARRPVSL